jgi:adenosylcobinamide hydrolase
LTDLSRFKSLNFPDAMLDWGVGHYIVRLGAPMQFLSSAPLGGGLLEAQWVLSLQVDANADLFSPEDYLLDRARSLGVPPEEPCIGLLTAVYHEDLQIHAGSEGGVSIVVLATVGITNGSSPRQKQISYFGSAPRRIGDPDRRPGTINILTLVDANLAPGALLRASTIATEAKTLALVESRTMTLDGNIVTGTSTDVTVTGHTGRGRYFDNAGSATLVGWLIGDAVYRSVALGLKVFKERDKH